MKEQINVIGRKFLVNSKEWYNDNKNKEGHVLNHDKNTYMVSFTKNMSKYCGKTLVAISNVEENYKYVELKPEGEWSEKFPINSITLLKETRKIPSSDLELVDKLLETPYILESTNGEMHGGGTITELNKKNTFACFMPDGKVGIKLPTQTQFATLKQVKELINKNKCDISFSTGMSFIRREWEVSKTKEKLKEYKY